MHIRGRRSQFKLRKSAGGEKGGGGEKYFDREEKEKCYSAPGGRKGSTHPSPRA